MWVLPPLLAGLLLLIDGGEIHTPIVALALFGALNWWQGIALTHTEAVVYNLTRKRVPWADIQAVALEGRFRFSKRVVLWSHEHGRVNVPNVVASVGSRRGRVEDLYHQIGQWWLEHRGADWKLVPWTNPWSGPPPPSPPYDGVPRQPPDS